MTRERVSWLLSGVLLSAALAAAGSGCSGNGETYDDVDIRDCMPDPD
jgi:hypothetical protein